MLCLSLRHLRHVLQCVIRGLEGLDLVHRDQSHSLIETLVLQQQGAYLFTLTNYLEELGACDLLEGAGVLVLFNLKKF